MRLKTNLVIGVLFAALAGYVYLHEIKGEEERRAEAERSSKLVEFSDHEVQRISIQRESGDDTVVERRIDEWWVVQPVETLADEEAVERYLRNVGETTSERVIEDSSSTAGGGAAEIEVRYGLAKPRLSLFMELSEGQLDTIRFGSDSPTERFAYAQKRGANRQVFTVRAWRFDNLDKGLFDLRDKRLLAFDKEAVREIRLENDEFGAGDGIQLTRAPEGDGWQIKSPVQADADKSEVDGILNKLLNATAESFETEAPDEAGLEAAGLAPRPSRAVTLTVGEDRAVKTLHIGHPSGEDGHFLARDLGRDPVFLIDSTVVSTLGKPLFTLRDKNLLPLDDDEEVQRLEMHRVSELVFAAELDSSGSWVVLAPEQRSAKSWKINGMLTDVREIQVQEFVAEDAGGGGLDLARFGLDEPQVRLRLASDDNAELELLLGSQTDEGIYAMVSGAGGSGVTEIGAEILKTLEVTLDDVAQPAPTPQSVTPDSVVVSGSDPTDAQ